MLKSIVFIISLVLLGAAWISNGILAHSSTPELSPIVAGVYLLGLSGLTFNLLSVLTTVREWQESRV